MKSNSSNALYWKASLLLLIILFGLSNKLWNIKKNQKDLNATIIQTAKQADFLETETASILNEIKSQFPRLDNTVPNDTPIAWSLKKMNSLIGRLDDVNIEYLGKKPFPEMKITRTTQDTMSGLGITLVPYLIRLELTDISFSKLQYIIERLNSTESYGIIELLNIKFNQEENTISALILFSLPTFYRPEDYAEMRELSNLISSANNTTLPL